MQLGNISWPDKAGGILAPAEHDQALFDKVRALRADGEVVVQQLPGQKGNLVEMGCDRVLRWNGSASALLLGFTPGGVRQLNQYCLRLFGIGNGRIEIQPGIGVETTEIDPLGVDPG